MVRTVIAIDERDKAWLDRQAAREGVPMTELVRRAIRVLRANGAEIPGPALSLDESLQLTTGIWRGPDGLEHQERLRDEW